MKLTKLLTVSLILGVSAVAIGGTAIAQPFALRDKLELDGKPRIVKGTIERVGDEFIILKVQSIFVPREGALEKIPDSIKIAITPSSRFIKEMDRKSTLNDFAVGDMVVAMTIYDESSGYRLKSLMDPASAVAIRRRMGQMMAQRFNERRGRRGMMLKERLKERFSGRMPPLLTAEFLGFGDRPGTVRLKITGVYKPRGDVRPRFGGGPFAESRVVTVHVFDKAKLFENGKKAELSDFEKGEEVIVIIRGLRADTDRGPELMLMVDKESAKELRRILFAGRRHLRDKPKSEPHGRF